VRAAERVRGSQLNERAYRVAAEREAQQVQTVFCLSAWNSRRSSHQNLACLCFKLGQVTQQVAGKPNHSLNLTRNSVPHWRGEARYAHNAPPRQRVTLSHSG
jgi:hypothetical protein